ncbi:MAG: hypothetical protein HY344_02115 [Candidatus Levybacteria bacterium]|nr:hypothetical protein [Candidatus Levybacteria bacterium]
MPIENIRLIPSLIVPIERVDHIAREIAEGRYYGKTAPKILGPNDTVEGRLEITTGNTFHRVVLGMDGSPRYETYRLEDMQPGSNVALRHEISVFPITKDSPPVCIFDAVTRAGDRVRIHSVCRYVPG